MSSELQNNSLEAMRSRDPESDRGTDTGLAKLVFRSGPLRGNVLALEKERISLGRDPRNDVAIADKVISGFHAAIVRDEKGSYWLEDLGSKNGTFLNGQPVTRERLRDRDVFYLSQCGPEIQFVLGSPELPGILESTTATFSRTRSIRRAFRELLPLGKSHVSSLLQLTGVRRLIEYGLEERTRRARWGFLGLTAAFFVLSAASLLGTLYLQSSRSRGEVTDLPIPPPGERMARVKLEAKLEPIYGSLFLSYRENPIGHARVKNVSEETVSGLEIAFGYEVEERFLVEPYTVVVPEILPGQEQVVPIRPKLSDQVLSERTREVPAWVELRKSTEVLARVVLSQFIHDWHVFSWEDPDRIAAFVDPRDVGVNEFVRAVSPYQPLAEERAFPSPNVVRALTFLTGLAELGLRYLPEGKHPVSSRVDDMATDLVNYPFETLLAGAGDCDDLSVLCCAVLERLDIPTALVVGDRHVFFLFDTGITPGDIARLPLDLENFVVRGGKVWMPIEATEFGRPGGNFASAWSRTFGCSAKIEAGELKVIELRVAQRKYQPMNPLPNERSRAALLSMRWTKEGLRESVQFGLSSLSKFFLSALEGRLKEIDEAEVGLARDQAKARLLAEAGFIEEARKIYETALFGAPRSPEELEDWFAQRAGQGLEEEKAILLADLGLCIALGPRSRSDLVFAAACLETAIAALENIDAAGKAELMLRLALVHSLRGDIAERESWKSRAFAMEPSLRATYEALLATEGRVGASGPDPRISQYLRRGLGALRRRST